MKRFNFNLKRRTSLVTLSKTALIMAILLVLDMSTAINADAQRRGGHSGMSRMHSRSMNVARMPHMSRGHVYNNFRINRNRPHWNYYYFPSWGEYYWGLPYYGSSFAWNGFNYYYDDGIYYRSDEGQYEVVPAPLGYKTKSIPKDCFQFNIENVTYYYYYGSYYVQKDDQYEVVNPPVGANVPAIPKGYDQVVIDGQTYYTLNGVQYKAILLNNEIWYQIIKSDQK